MQKSYLFWFESGRVPPPAPPALVSISVSSVLKWRWNCCGHVGEVGLSGERGKSWWSFRNSHMRWYLFWCILLCWNNTLLWDGRRLTQAAVLPHWVIKMNTIQIVFASQRHSAISSSPSLQFCMGGRCKYFHSIVPESLHQYVCITVLTLQMTDADLHIKRQPIKPHTWWMASLGLAKNVRSKHHFLAVSFLGWCGNKLNLFISLIWKSLERCRYEELNHGKTLKQVAERQF